MAAIRRFSFSVGRRSGLRHAAPSGTMRGSFTAPYSFATRSLTVTCDAARGARAMRGSGSAAPRVPRT
jgi:hypothetical protein